MNRCQGKGVASFTRVCSVAIAVAVVLGKGLVGQDQTAWSGIYTTEQANRGKAEFVATCSTCHLDSATAPALIGETFISTWDNQTVRDLYSRLRTTMPADNPGTLSETITLDIVAYLLQANGFPAGTEELKGGADRLQAIRITRRP